MNIWIKVKSIELKNNKPALLHHHHLSDSFLSHSFIHFLCWLFRDWSSLLCIWYAWPCTLIKNFYRKFCEKKNRKKKEGKCRQLLCATMTATILWFCTSRAKGNERIFTTTYFTHIHHSWRKRENALYHEKSE